VKRSGWCIRVGSTCPTQHNPLMASLTQQTLTHARTNALTHSNTHWPADSRTHARTHPHKHASTHETHLVESLKLDLPAVFITCARSLCIFDPDFLSRVGEAVAAAAVAAPPTAAAAPPSAASALAELLLLNILPLAPAGPTRSGAVLVLWLQNCVTRPTTQRPIDSLALTLTCAHAHVRCPDRAQLMLDRW
jgi:hypothetical protein